MHKLSPGRYFFRVMATNEDGKTQYAMSYYVSGIVKYYGVQCFDVLDNGTVVQEEAVE